MANANEVPQNRESASTEAYAQSQPALHYSPAQPATQPNNGTNMTYPPPHFVQHQQREGWCERNHKNKPQSNSVGTGALIFISGGMNIAWSFNFVGANEHMRASWFIGAIIGAVLGAIVVKYIQKKVIVLFSAYMVVLGGALFISLPQNIDAILAARYCDGIASGLTFVSMLILAGEEVVADMRGMITSSTESMSIATGIFLQIIFYYEWNYEMTSSSLQSNQLQGILSVVFGVVAFAIGFFLIIESPVWFLLRNREQQAVESLRRLHRPFVVTQETFSQLEQIKSYVAENEQIGRAEAIVGGWPALLKLCIYRGMVALSFSTAFYITFSIASTVSQGLVYWPYIICGTLRWIATLISSLLMDKAGRKKILLGGILVCAGMALGVGIIFNDLTNLISQYRMNFALALMLIYQFFAGIFITPSSTYLTEAFPLFVKPYYIALAFITEMLVQIIIIYCKFDVYYMADYFFSLFGLSVAFFIVGLLCFPETRKTTLIEAQHKFRKLITNELNNRMLY